jgi:hypothetical protein
LCLQLLDGSYIHTLPAAAARRCFCCAPPPPLLPSAVRRRPPLQKTQGIKKRRRALSHNGRALPLGAESNLSLRRPLERRLKRFSFLRFPAGLCAVKQISFALSNI